MGQRGNYVLQYAHHIEIYYTHWRANQIAPDLLLGESQFVDFVKKFNQYEVLVTEPWIEGCVVVDFVNKSLLFWEQELLSNSTVRDRYVQLLLKKWSGWHIEYAENEMYDVERKLGLDYTQQQELFLKPATYEDILLESIDDEYFYGSLIVIFENNAKFFKTGSAFDCSDYVMYGPDVIKLLKDKPAAQLQKEVNHVFMSQVLFDLDNQKIVLGECKTGLREAFDNIWPGWTIETANCGYVAFLNRIGIDTSLLRMTPDEVSIEIQNILDSNSRDNFDPQGFAQSILSSTEGDVQFNPDFFEDIKPARNFNQQRSLFGKIVKAIRSWFNKT